MQDRRWRQLWSFAELSILLLALVPALAAVSGTSMNFGALAKRASGETGVPWTSSLWDMGRLGAARPGLWLMLVGSAVPSLAALVVMAASRDVAEWRSFARPWRPVGQQLPRRRRAFACDRNESVAGPAPLAEPALNRENLLGSSAGCGFDFRRHALAKTLQTRSPKVDWYRTKTALIGLKRLATLSEEDKQGCVDAYKFFQRMQAGEETSTEDETKAVADYYKVLNNMLSVFDLEKLYIPPMLDDSKGLYDNQLLCEQAVLKELALEKPEMSHLLDMGCGRGRIAHYLATLTDGQVSGYNIDPNQVENAIAWAAECGMSDRLHFKVGNHHEPLDYESESFDGCFSFQAVWPFFKKEELLDHAQEMYRVLKPGARYACSEYLLTPHFDWNNEEHVALHKKYLPTLAATQSMYPADVCAALEEAGFEVLVSAPSKSEAWPLCEQKRDLILMGRRVVRALEKVGILPPWVEESLELLQTGGQAWTDAEKAKIADLNWRIVAVKP